MRPRPEKGASVGVRSPCLLPEVPWAALIRRPVFRNLSTMSYKWQDKDLPPLPMAEAVWHEISRLLELPPQQAKVVELILRGMQDKEIAAALGLSFPTVRTHLRRIFDRLEVTDRVGVVLRVFAMAQKHEEERHHNC